MTRGVKGAVGIIFDKASKFVTWIFLFHSESAGSPVMDFRNYWFFSAKTWKFKKKKFMKICMKIIIKLIEKFVIAKRLVIRYHI